MNKILFILLLALSLLNAKIINGVAIVVNDIPITLYDIKSTMDKLNVPQNKAASILIDKALYDNLVYKYDINVDIFDIDTYVENLAKNNNMDVYKFKSIVKQKYKSYADFEKEVQEMITRDKLIKKIIKGNLSVANDEDMKSYYKKHKAEFVIAEEFEVIEYKSKNKASLTKTLQNPLMIDEEVRKEEVSFKINQITSQLKYILNTTKENTFSPIFVENKFYTALYIKEKKGKTTLKYEDVKNKIFAQIMTLREKKYLKEYFEKQKVTADIQIVR